MAKAKTARADRHSSNATKGTGTVTAKPKSYDLSTMIMDVVIGDLAPAACSSLAVFYALTGSLPDIQPALELAAKLSVVVPLVYYAYHTLGSSADPSLAYNAELFRELNGYGDGNPSDMDVDATNLVTGFLTQSALPIAAGLYAISMYDGLPTVPTVVAGTLGWAAGAYALYMMEQQSSASGSKATKKKKTQ